MKTLRLKGIRSWKEGEIPFTEGFTAIVGPKGVGKSSIITTVEFVLFGDEAFRDYAGLMREDSNASEAVLQIEDQGRGFIITRGLTRVGNKISQDSERLKLEVDGIVHTVGKAGDLNRDVRELLRVDNELLEHTCLARQEELKKLLNIDARSRKNVVDRLLGFDSFEIAWRELGEIIRDKEGYARRLREGASKYDLESLSKDYEETLEQIEDLKRKNRKAEERCRFEREELEFVELELKGYDQIARRYNEERKKIEEKRKQLADGIARSEGFKGRISTLKQSLEDMEKEKKHLEEQREELWANLAKIGYAGDTELASLKEVVRRLNKTILETLSTISIDEKAIEDEQNKESVLSDTEVCPYCGQRLSSHKTEKFRMEHLKNLRENVRKNRTVLDSSERLLKVYENYNETLDRVLYQIERLKSQIQSISLQTGNVQK